MRFHAGDKIVLSIHPAVKITVSGFFCDTNGMPVLAYSCGSSEMLIITGTKTDPDDQCLQLYTVHDRWGNYLRSERGSL